MRRSRGGDRPETTSSWSFVVCARFDVGTREFSRRDVFFFYRLSEKYDGHAIDTTLDAFLEEKYPTAGPSTVAAASGAGAGKTPRKSTKKIPAIPTAAAVPARLLFPSVQAPTTSLARVSVVGV